MCCAPFPARRACWALPSSTLHGSEGKPEWGTMLGPRPRVVSDWRGILGQWCPSLRFFPRCCFCTNATRAPRPFARGKLTRLAEGARGIRVVWCGTAAWSEDGAGSPPGVSRTRSFRRCPPPAPSPLSYRPRQLAGLWSFFECRACDNNSKTPLRRAESAPEPRPGA